MHSREQEEMLDPQRGLLQHIRKEFLKTTSHAIPDIRDNKVSLQPKPEASTLISRFPSLQARTPKR